MKKVIVIFLFVILISPRIIFSQEGQNTEIELIQSKLGLHYLNFKSGCNYIIDFMGDSIKQHSNSQFFQIDEKVITVIDFPFSIEQFSNKDGEKELDELLIDCLRNEEKYLEKEVYNSKLDINKKFFNNTESKRFLLWHYRVPEKFREKIIKEKELVEMTVTVNYSYLFFVCNNVVVGISIATSNEDKINSDIKYLIKKVAENIDVFGGPINKTAWLNKITSIEKNEPFIYTDSVNKYRIHIPLWINVANSRNEGNWIGTLPDINNIKNAIAIASVEKSQFESFKDFNNYYIKGNVFGKPALFNENIKWMGQKELKNPKGCNGIAYKVYTMRGSSIYHCQYTTYETATSYILINFVATPNTFKINKGKLDEFLNNFEIIE